MLGFQADPKHLWLSLVIATVTAALVVGTMSALGTLGHSVTSLTGEDFALIGAVGWILTATTLLWASARLRKQQDQAHGEGPVDKTAEARLRENLERTRLILDGTLDAVVGMDLQGEITDWNAKAETMFGWSQKEAVGLKLAETIIPPRYRAAHEQGIRRYLASGKGPFLNRRIELSALRRDGTEFPIELTITPLKLGESYVFSSFIADITERKRVEETLRDSQERFRKAFSEASIGMALCATDGRWLQVNRALCQIVGYSEQELLATNFQAITHPDDLDTDLALARQLLNGEIPNYEMEKRYIHKLGHMVWILLTGSVVRDAKGVPLYFIAQIQDITERKRQEQIISKSRDYYLKLLDEFPSPFWRSGLNAKCDYVNKSWLAFTGRTFEQECGDGWAEGIHPEDRDRCMTTYLAAFRARKPFEMEYRLRRHDGEYRSIIDVGQPYYDLDNNFAGFIGSAYDITERKQAEEAQRHLIKELAESRNRFEMFFRETPSAIAITTIRDGRFLDVNAHAEVLTGYSREELIGRTTVEMNLYLDSSDRPKIVQALQEKGVLTDLERLVKTKSGVIRTAIFSLVPVQIGSEPCLLSIAHDITERRKAEEALRAHEQMLRALMNERDQLLQDLHDGIIQSLYAIGMSIDESRRLTAEDPAKAGMKLDQTVGDINGVIREVRQHLLSGNDSLPCSAHRLKAELTRIAGTMERANSLHFRLRVDARAAECLTPEERREILYIAQETMSNCLRHSGATSASVSLRLGRDRVHLEVEDDGRGFDTTILPGTNGGLRNIEQRAVKIGARVEIVSRREHGTRVRLSVPTHE